MLKLNISRIIIALLMLSIGAVAQSVVKGTVYDRNDAVLPGFVVRAANVKTVVETKTDADGAYFLRLPPGIYSLSAQWEKAGYWYPLRRSNLLVEADRIYEVDLWPSQRILSISLMVTSRGSSEPTTLSRIPQYREYSFSVHKEIKLILQFSKSHRRGNTFENVIVTYDRYTIHADEAEVDRQTSVITLKGNVRFFRNSRMISSNHAILILDPNTPTLSIEGNRIVLHVGGSE